MPASLDQNANVVEGRERNPGSRSRVVTGEPDIEDSDDAMRIPTLTTLILLTGMTPAVAQLSGGVGSSNAANQSFQLQNQIRGLQQQQTFDTNQTRMQIERNQLYDRRPSQPSVILRR